MQRDPADPARRAGQHRDAIERHVIRLLRRGSRRVRAHHDRFAVGCAVDDGETTHHDAARRDPKGRRLWIRRCEYHGGHIGRLHAGIRQRVPAHQPRAVHADDEVADVAARHQCEWRRRSGVPW